MTQPALIVLRPGDKVLVTLADEVDDETAKTVLTTLRRSFRGCEFTILAGVTAVAVQPGNSPT